jgi:two-component system LytT family response regulator
LCFLLPIQAFALRAYDFNVIDYVIKPFTLERFNKAMQKVIDLFSLSAIQTKITLFYSNPIFYSINLLATEIKYIEGFGEYIKDCYLTIKCIWYYLA